MRYFPVTDRWCIHAYYTVSPYAPDGSGRILVAGADLATHTGEVIVLSSEGAVLDRFGAAPVNAGFWHTGFWQTWSPDARYVYFQQGSSADPRIVRRELATGAEITIQGDAEGAPPDGEPLISGLMGMLYAAGYGTGVYAPDQAPVPFQARDQHGLFAYTFAPSQGALRLSVAEIIDQHPDRDALHRADRAIKDRLGDHEGLTLMAYCVRWSPDGSRFLFYFGNHTVRAMVPERDEPKLAYVFTAKRDFSDLHLALNLGFGKPGVHWSWHLDGEHLVGYGPDPDDESKLCLAQVRFDGSDYRRLSRHASGGHPSISPVDHHLAVTDNTGKQPGDVLFIDTRTDTVVKTVTLSRVYGDTEPRGRNPLRVCHHPVFNHDGSAVLVNTLSDRHAVVCEVAAP